MRGLDMSPTAQLWRRRAVTSNTRRRGQVLQFAVNWGSPDDLGVRRFAQKLLLEAPACRGSRLALSGRPRSSWAIAEDPF